MPFSGNEGYTPQGDWRNPRTWGTGNTFQTPWPEFDQTFDEFKNKKPGWQVWADKKAFYEKTADLTPLEREGLAASGTSSAYDPAPTPQPTGAPPAPMGAGGAAPVPGAAPVGGSMDAAPPGGADFNLGKQEVLPISKRSVPITGNAPVGMGIRDADEIRRRLGMLSLMLGGTGAFGGG